MVRQKLLLMRHAKSDWSADGLPDFERPLNKRGRKTAPAVGKWLRQKRLKPDVFVSSPALRARETALLVADELGFPVEAIVFDEAMYDAALGDLLSVIARWREGAQVLLLVGHNPGFDTVLTHLCSKEPPEDAEGRLLTTAAVAVLALDAAQALDPGSARLEILRRPKDPD